MKKAIYIFPGLFALVPIVLLLIGNLGPSQPCKNKKEFILSAYKAVITDKYLDKKNHNYKTLLYSSNKKSFIMQFFDDTSGYYDYVKIGDTIYKTQNSDWIEVNGLKKFKIYFDCK